MNIFVQMLLRYDKEVKSVKNSLINYLLKWQEGVFLCKGTSEGKKRRVTEYLLCGDNTLRYKVCTSLTAHKL